MAKVPRTTQEAILKAYSSEYEYLFNNLSVHLCSSIPSVVYSIVKVLKKTGVFFKYSKLPVSLKEFETSNTLYVQKLDHIL